LKRNSAALALFAISAVAAERHEFVQPAMGTLARITVYAEHAGTAEAASKAAFTRIQQLNAALSDYEPESELMRLCRRPPGESVPISADLFTVLSHAQTTAEQTGGAFDVTLGPLVRLWREARKRRRLPSHEEIATARQRCGYRNLRLDAQGRTVTLAVPGMFLDLGGIAKGYAAEAALSVLRERGITQALVAIGGDLAIGHPPPGKHGWRIGLAATGETRLLYNVCVSTSGDTEQYVEIGGVRYSHILDPATGLGVKGRRMVTVIAPDGMTADSLATALSVPGVDPGPFQSARVQVILSQ
jgi:thiamine biosynthesis lipoprotein